jgi:hypothetical protein
MTRWLLILATLVASASGPAHAQTADGGLSSIERIKGIGKTVDEAKQDARAVALVMLQGRLLTHDPPLTDWQPTILDVERFVQGQGKAGEAHPIQGGGHVETWVLEVRLPAIDEMERQNERVRRIWLAWEVFFVTLVGLGVWVAVDESTRAWRARRAAVKS